MKIKQPYKEKLKQRGIINMTVYKPNSYGLKYEQIRDTAKKVYNKKGSDRFYFYEIEVEYDKNTLRGIINLMKQNGWIADRERDYKGYLSWKLTGSAIEWLKNNKSELNET